MTSTVTETKTIRFDLTPAERESDECTLGFTFSIGAFGVSITEHWPNNDEIYGDGCNITVPPRIWALALPWLINNSTTR